MRTFFCALLMIALTATKALAAEPKPFNDYILKSVAKIYAERKAQGYDINSYFTHHLGYGPDLCATGIGRCIKANNAPKTMCVAAVVEVIVEALNLYYAETRDRDPFRTLGIVSWQRGRPTDIRAHMFEYSGTNSHGVAQALATFGIGTQAAFEQLKPGSFVKFDRASGGGHSTVFLGFIDKDGNDVRVYGDKVAGFKYFSAQGAGKPDGGFGYRWAYFDGTCHKSPDKPHDCRVVRRSIVTGFMFHPASWTVEEAKGRFVEGYARSKISALLEAQGILPTDNTLKGIFRNRLLRDSLIDRVAPELKQEGTPGDLSAYDGVTGDE